MNELAAPMRDMTSNVTRIVEAFLAHNPCTMTELPKLIANVRASLAHDRSSEPEPELKILSPAVPIAKSVAPHYVTCLECGKTFKSLRGHLRVAHDLLPAEYRKKWGLKADHPMVAPEYAAIRSQLSKELALGGRRRVKGRSSAPPAGGATRPPFADDSRFLAAGRDNRPPEVHLAGR